MQANGGATWRMKNYIYQQNKSTTSRLSESNSYKETEAYIVLSPQNSGRVAFQSILSLVLPHIYIIITLIWRNTDTLWMSKVWVPMLQAENLDFLCKKLKIGWR